MKVPENVKNWLGYFVPIFVLGLIATFLVIGILAGVTLYVTSGAYYGILIAGASLAALAAGVLSFKLARKQ